jgi:sigma-B regulation protein RsbU (phosphoserine phosphatase)
LIGSLEQRVAARTRDLKIATQVSEQVATILDIDQLLPQMVELTKSSFDLYHAHAYLLDEKGENLVLAAGAGEAGQVMKQRKHSIPLDAERSLVARAARGNTPIVVDDVRNEPGFLANPLLPNTHSEAAFPLAVGDRVLGVLDVQSTEVGHFDADMQSVLTTLAGQVAVAIDNARLFSSVESASRHEQALSTITQEIGRATNMDEVLQIAARELGKALRVPYTAIELQVPSGRTTENETPVQDLEVETQ